MFTIVRFNFIFIYSRTKTYLCGETTSKDKEDSKLKDREDSDIKAKVLIKEIKDLIIKVKDGTIKAKDLTNKEIKDGVTKDKVLIKEIRVSIKARAKDGMVIRAIKGGIIKEVKVNGEIREVKDLTKVVTKDGEVKATKVLIKDKEIKVGATKAKALISKEIKDGVTKVKVSIKAADKTGVAILGIIKIRVGDQEDMYLCLTGKTNLIATSLPFNLPWAARNAEAQVCG